MNTFLLNKLFSLRRPKKYCRKCNYIASWCSIFFCGGLPCLYVLTFWGGRVIKDILCTACYPWSLFSKARLEKQSLFILEISCLSFLNFHSWTLNFGLCKDLCFFERCFVQWVLSVSSKGGLQDIAKPLGLGESINRRLCREQKESSGTSVSAINTDFLVKIEMPTILSWKDRLQGITTRFV